MTTAEDTLAQALQYHQQGNLAQAHQLYQQLLQGNPNNAEVHHLLGLLAYQTGRFDAALAAIAKAVSLKPTSAAYRTNLGLAHLALGQRDQALGAMKLAVQLQADFAEGHRNLGQALASLGSAEEALVHFRQALQIRPDYVEAHNSTGIAFLRLGSPYDAINHFRQALVQKPDYVEAQTNLGIALKQLGRFEEAAASFDQALRQRPGNAIAHWNRAMLRLAGGDFVQGWRDYEWRWAVPGVLARQFPQPLWDGTPFPGKTILIHAEQGFGDLFHFVRYLTPVKRLGGKIVFECPAPLMPLVASVPEVGQLVVRGSSLPPFTVHAPLLSLPGILRTTLDTIPSAVPYLLADAKLVRQWQGTLESITGMKVGIAWQGSAENTGDRQRSISVNHFERLAQIPGVQLISLQKNCPQRVAISYQPQALDEAAGAFMDTAAIMMNLDLVICADTAVAHLAGALGVPTWVALSLAPDWRWLLERVDSPWYPTLRLFRQSSFGHWDDVFDRIAEELRLLVKKRS